MQHKQRKKDYVTRQSQLFQSMIHQLRTHREQFKDRCTSYTPMDTNRVHLLIYVHVKELLQKCTQACIIYQPEQIQLIQWTLDQGAMKNQFQHKSNY